MITRAEIKARAKAALGGNLFGQVWMMALLACLIVTAIESATSAIYISFIVIGPLSVGLACVFLRLVRGAGSVNIGDTFYGFSSDFGGTFLTGLMINIFTALWSMLFVIPGIVKSYSYSMAYYIKADHPEYDWRQAINESKRIMQGYKGALFVLDLSFIGWYIVGAMCLGVGTLWVNAYHNAARAEFYENLPTRNIV